MNLTSSFVTDPPPRRPLKVYAIDPMLGREAGNRISIDVPNEPLTPGPAGERIEVIDYDGAHKRFYPPVNLNEDAILMQGGLEPSESDPRFHQQMVYAVAMRTIESFDRALGRKLSVRRKKYPRLRLFPHAFHGANAFYDRDLHGICFGYFKADQDDPGANLPGQMVFTCLSHDVVAHEMTHALVDRLRRYFLEPSNVDVLAFHEGFADIVALLGRFSFQDLLADRIQKARGDLRQKTDLVKLAQQFGQATGRGRELRSALDVKADPAMYRNSTEPHERGSILVSAVFDAFFTTYQRRIADLIRIASGGSGRLPEGDLLPDLVNRIAREASRSAQATLNMCIRAFDYLPPVDIRFGDYLRSLVTADYELSPSDEFGTRGAMIEAFRVRGIYPDGVISLAEESLIWPTAEKTFPRLPMNTVESLREMMYSANAFSRTAAWTEQTGNQPERAQSYSESDEGTDRDVGKDAAVALWNWANQNRAKLLLDPKLRVEVHGFHTAFRVSPGGQLLTEVVAQFAQADKADVLRRGGIPLRGGTTVVAAADGTVRYLITKPIPSANLDAVQKKQAQLRVQRQDEYLTLCDGADPKMSNLSPSELGIRMRSRGNLAAIHLG
jgi:hypothetical protein